MSSHTIQSTVKWLLAAVLALAAVIAALLNGPVNTEWKALTVQIDGPDLIVAGTMVKVRACKYIPPPRARDETGLNLKVISLAAAAGQSWQPADEPQQFGPWRVINGAGKRLTFYQEHECHGFWHTFTTLGMLKGTP